MIVTTESDVFRRLDEAIEAKTLGAIREWMAEQGGYMIVPPVLSAQAQSITRGIHVRGAIWN